MTTQLERYRLDLEQQCQPFYDMLARLYTYSRPSYLYDFKTGQLTLQSDGLPPEINALVERCKAAIHDLRSRYWNNLAKLGYIITPDDPWLVRSAFVRRDNEPVSL